MPLWEARGSASHSRTQPMFRIFWRPTSSAWWLIVDELILTLLALAAGWAVAKFISWGPVSMQPWQWGLGVSWLRFNLAINSLAWVLILLDLRRSINQRQDGNHGERVALEKKKKRSNAIIKNEVPLRCICLATIGAHLSIISTKCVKRCGDRPCLGLCAACVFLR